MLFTDLAKVLLLTQTMPAATMPGASVIIISTRDLGCTDMEFGVFDNAAFCGHALLSQAVYLSGMFERSWIV